MRMWMIDPQLLCNKHLVGEHGEIHKHKPSFIKKHSISGRLSPIVQIEPESMGIRHDELVIEMEERGMHHHSHYYLPDLSYLPKEEREAKVDHLKSIEDLSERCRDCRKRIKWFKKNNQ